MRRRVHFADIREANSINFYELLLLVNWIPFSRKNFLVRPRLGKSFYVEISRNFVWGWLISWVTGVVNIV